MYQSYPAALIDTRIIPYKGSDENIRVEQKNLTTTMRLAKKHDNISNQKQKEPDVIDQRLPRLAPWSKSRSEFKISALRIKL